MASPLAEAHIEGERRLRGVVTGQVASIWRGLPGYDRQNVDEWLTRVLPIILAGRRASVSLTDGYLARALARPPLGINPEQLAIRNGAAPEEVYRRPFVTLWSALTDGKQYTDALSLGLERATSTAATDMQLAMRETVREVGEEDEAIVGYERVPDGGACDLCLIASTQRYHFGDLMPIHNRCGCGVEPLFVERGQVINPDLLSELKQSGAVQRISAQRQARRVTEGRGQVIVRGTVDPARMPDVAIREHGELGPVLTDADHDFTSESDI